MKITANYNGQEVTVTLNSLNIEFGKYGYHKIKVDADEHTTLNNKSQTTFGIKGELKERIIQVVEEVVKEQIVKELQDIEEQKVHKAQRDEVHAISSKIREITCEIESSKKAREGVMSGQEFDELLKQELELNKQLESLVKEKEQKIEEYGLKE